MPQEEDLVLKRVSDKRAQPPCRYWDKNARNSDQQIAFWKRRLFGDGRQWVCAQTSGEVLEVALAPAATSLLPTGHSPDRHRVLAPPCSRPPRQLELIAWQAGYPADGSSQSVAPGSRARPEPVMSQLVAILASHRVRFGVAHS
jgi:hypothetical protein